MATEDFTTFTFFTDQVPDPFTITADKIDFDGVNPHDTCDQTTYIYKDYGVDYFDDSFEATFHVNITSMVDGSQMYICTLANDPNMDWYDLDTGNKDGVSLGFIRIGANLRITLRELVAGALHSTNYDFAYAWPDDYYIRFRLDKEAGQHGWLMVWIYNDSAMTDLRKTFYHVLNSTESFRYLYALQSLDAAAAGRDVKAYIEGLEIIEPLVGWETRHGACPIDVDDYDDFEAGWPNGRETWTIVTSGAGGPSIGLDNAVYKSSTNSLHIVNDPGVGGKGARFTTSVSTKCTSIVSCWVRMNAIADGGLACIIGLSDVGVRLLSAAVHRSGDTYRWRVADWFAPSTWNTKYGPSVGTSTWYHIVLVLAADWNALADYAGMLFVKGDGVNDTYQLVDYINLAAVALYTDRVYVGHMGGGVGLYYGDMHIDDVHYANGQPMMPKLARIGSTITYSNIVRQTHLSPTVHSSHWQSGDDGQTFTLKARRAVPNDGFIEVADGTNYWQQQQYLNGANVRNSKLWEVNQAITVFNLRRDNVGWFYWSDILESGKLLCGVLHGDTDVKLDKSLNYVCFGTFLVTNPWTLTEAKIVKTGELAYSNQYYPNETFVFRKSDDKLAAISRWDHHLCFVTDHVHLSYSVCTGVPFSANEGLLTGSGNNTAILANKLIDGGATFQDDDVAVGDTVWNTTDGTRAQVTAVDSQIQLALDADIFPAPAGDGYEWSCWGAIRDPGDDWIGKSGWLGASMSPSFLWFQGRDSHFGIAEPDYLSFCYKVDPSFADGDPITILKRLNFWCPYKEKGNGAINASTSPGEVWLDYTTDIGVAFFLQIGTGEEIPRASSGAAPGRGLLTFM